MKKIFIIVSLIAFAFFISCKESAGQDITRNATKVYKTGFTYAKYKGVAADSLTDNQDTIDVVFNMRVHETVKRVSLGSTFDLMTTTDSIVAISVLAEDFDNDSYSATVIASSNSGEITADNTFAYDASAYTEEVAAYLSAVPAHNAPYVNVAAGTADTLKYDAYNITNAAQTVTPVNLSYRKYVVRLIYKGDATGTGVKIDPTSGIELKLHHD